MTNGPLLEFNSGADNPLRQYMKNFAFGLTSNPTIFDNAIRKPVDCDAAIDRKLSQGKAGEELFF